MATKKKKNMKSYTFRITAKIMKDITVDVDTTGLNEDEAEQKAREEAHQQFNPNCDGEEESYDQDDELINPE